MTVTSLSVLSLYPGQNMGAQAILALAEAYRADALELLKIKASQRQRRHEPFRLLVIHAIELYLNAFLLAQGMEATAIRGMQHDLAKRAALVREAGLMLRSKTQDHLATLSATKEYLMTRYGSPEPNSLSQLNRLEATLEEVRKRVTQRVQPQTAVMSLTTA